MLSLPHGTEEPLALADWLELNALIGSAGQANLDDLMDGLRVGSIGAIADETRPEQLGRLEGIAAAVRAELEFRARVAQVSYPFRFRGSSLERRIPSGRCTSSTYSFCLILSAIPWHQLKFPHYFPDRIFEEVACQVAEKYLGGESLRFGWPRRGRGVPSSFEKAIVKLCLRMGEGNGFRDDDATGNEKDAGLDVVAWRPIDERSGKLLLFGACATGGNWEGKLDELQPKHFCTTYLQGSNTLAPAKAFFTPRVVPQERWRLYTSRAGIIFDRCRVSLLVPELPEKGYHGDVREWMQMVIRRAGEER